MLSNLSFSNNKGSLVKKQFFPWTSPGSQPTTTLPEYCLQSSFYSNHAKIISAVSQLQSKYLKSFLCLTSSFHSQVVLTFHNFLSQLHLPSEATAMTTLP